MKIISKNCPDCGSEVEKVPNARYPRKYCKKCSEKRKKDWEDIHLISVDDCEEEV
jgi:hypothetical protein